MHAAWTRLRRAVASLMLAAMASFVLHAGAVAGGHAHGPSAVDCGSHASSKGHVHAAAHHGSAAVGHAYEADEAHAHGGHHAPHGSDDGIAAAEPCCGSMCSVAISTRAPEGASARLASPVEVLPDASQGPDTRPEGPKRPPRTPDIA